MYMVSWLVVTRLFYVSMIKITSKKYLIYIHFLSFFRNYFLNMAGKKKAPTKVVSKKTTKPVVDEKEKSEVKEWVYLSVFTDIVALLLRT